MATVYKSFLNDDVTTTRTLLHEAIPITGSIISGSIYAEENIKNYSHGRFQSVYDYPVLSSSANHILDLTVGVSADSTLTVTEQQSEKVQIYNQMAQMLVGHDETGNIRRFDRDGDLVSTSDKWDECFFFNFARLLSKDEIKKGSFSMTVGTGSALGNVFDDTLTITDAGAESDYRVNSPAGEYGILYASSDVPHIDSGRKVGLIYYQAGVVVLTPYAFIINGGADFDAAGEDLEGYLETSDIQSTCDIIRLRIQDIDFNNTIELNSTIYFCRVNHNEFNYSSNPTYLSSSQIVVKDQSLDSPVSYITSVGLYSSDNELLATAKLSEPLKKTPENELIVRVRLDY
jgi:hypothetical protein